MRKVRGQKAKKFRKNGERKKVQEKARGIERESECGCHDRGLSVKGSDGQKRRKKHLKEGKKIKKRWGAII